MAAKKADAYRKTQILTAPPEKLQLMLYDGAVRFATQGREALQRRDYETSYGSLVRAQNIVLELICGLRPEANPALCNKMASLYSFVYRKLLDANVRHDVAAVDDALSILEILRDTWARLLEKLAEERSHGEEAEVSANARA